MRRIWAWVKDDLWPIYKMYMVVGSMSFGFGAMYAVAMLDPQVIKTSYTTRADCTLAEKLHDKEVERLHDRNERNLRKLIIAEEQKKVWESIDMNDFIEDIPEEGG